MKFWKVPELDQDLENYLSTMLTPVSLRGDFRIDLKRRLLGDFPLVENKGNVLQSFALAAAGVFSVFMLIFTGLRALIFLFSVFGLLRQVGGEMQQKRSTA